MDFLTYNEICNAILSVILGFELPVMTLKRNNNKRIFFIY